MLADKALQPTPKPLRGSVGLSFSVRFYALPIATFDNVTTDEWQVLHQHISTPRPAR
jgi:hypothetical protein